MSRPLLSLCSVPKLATRDGQVGATAHFYLPFYDKGSGYWFASGREYTFPKTTIAQYSGATLNGTTKTTPYEKDCCSNL